MEDESYLDEAALMLVGLPGEVVERVIKKTMEGVIEELNHHPDIVEAMNGGHDEAIAMMVEDKINAMIGSILSRLERYNAIGNA